MASVCPYCGVGCQLSFKVRDEKIAWVDGVARSRQRAEALRQGPFRVRLRRPPPPPDHAADPPRRGAVEGPERRSREPRPDLPRGHLGGGARARGGGTRERLEAHGGDAIAGFGSAKCSNEEAYLFQKFIRQGFGTNNVDHCTRLCHASSVAALLENVGSGAVTATFNEIENADLAIVIGANPTENHPVAATYFKQFAKRGGNLILMDPRGMGLKRHARHSLQFQPGGGRGHDQRDHARDRRGGSSTTVSTSPASRQGGTPSAST